MSGLDNTSQTVRSLAANASVGITLSANDYVLIVTGGAVAQAVALAAAANAIPGREYTVINASGGTTTLTPGGGTINGGATLALATNTSATIIASGTNWYVKSRGSVA